jgi:hypothetical protein
MKSKEYVTKLLAIVGTETDKFMESMKVAQEIFLEAKDLAVAVSSSLLICSKSYRQVTYYHVS